MASDTTSVQIKRELLKIIKEKRGRGEIKSYINKLIENELMLEGVRATLHPRMELHGSSQNKLEIVDKKRGVNADVYISEKGVYCSRDKSSTCEHVLYARTLPELGMLKPRKSG